MFQLIKYCRNKERINDPEILLQLGNYSSEVTKQKTLLTQFVFNLFFKADECYDSFFTITKLESKK